MMHPDVWNASAAPCPRCAATRHRTCGVGRAFTLIEILIVVVILGIISSIVTLRFAAATQDAKISATREQLAGIRTAVEVYAARYGVYPAEGDVEDNWEILVTAGNFKEVPVNSYVGGENARVIRFADEPDSAYSAEYGWIYDQSRGRVWAAGFDGEDQPLSP